MELEQKIYVKTKKKETLEDSNCTIRTIHL